MKITMQNCKICCLYSGSKGNSTFISAGGAKILIDAGKSFKALKQALSDIGESIENIDAIFITHEHNDHISALRTLSHKHSIPIHMLISSAMIFRGLCDEKLCSCLVMHRGDSFEADVKGLHVKAFPTPHDSMGAVGYRLTFESGDNECSVAVSTDIGFVSDALRENLAGCEAVVLESNHDEEMLKNGPYPYELKRRIASKRGHLSNRECSLLASELYLGGLRHLLLAHLSEENNLPALAYSETFSAIADEDFDLRVARQDSPVWLMGEHENEV